jgi:hypothetical protein
LVHAPSGLAIQVRLSWIRFDSSEFKESVVELAFGFNLVNPKRFLTPVIPEQYS